MKTFDILLALAVLGFFVGAALGSNAVLILALLFGVAAASPDFLRGPDGDR